MSMSSYEQMKYERLENRTTSVSFYVLFSQVIENETSLRKSFSITFLGLLVFKIDHLLVLSELIWYCYI